MDEPAELARHGPPSDDHLRGPVLDANDGWVAATTHTVDEILADVSEQRWR